ncbi:MAG: class I SAM-dependent methyltransferase [Patescibacteria group bacterium]
MTNYDLFAKHYDEVMGDRSKNAAELQKLISKHHPKAKTILELACGTGSVLQHFAKRYGVYGLDLSSGMLSLARKKVPSGKFSQQDMTKFKLKEKFDVILCVFDSINHLLKFSDWQKVFKRAYEHLNEGGVLIFDMNTEVKLQRVIDTTPGVRTFGESVMIMDVTDIGKGVSNWNVKVFEHKNKNQYALYEENIKEKAFPLRQVKEALKRFRKVDVVDTSRKRPSVKSERLVFVCKK